MTGNAIMQVSQDGTHILPLVHSLLWELMHDPIDGGRAYMGDLTERERQAYGMGRLSVALAIETRTRILEALRGTSLVALNRETISESLRSVARSLGIDDDALEWYDALVEYAIKIGGASHLASHVVDDGDRPLSAIPARGTEQSVPEGTPIQFDDEPPSPTTAAA